MIFLLLFLLVLQTAEARDAKVVRAFRKANPCPVTQKPTGACPGWVVDHVVPLCWGGPDTVENMQWQDRQTSYLKDVFEREACAMKKKLGVSPVPTDN